jgi:DNA-directed RNA polymerase specialized sigma24 family protein
MQLNYISPTLTTNYHKNEDYSYFYISNNTERVALDRIESKRALDLNEEIERYKIIVESIQNAFNELKPQEKDFVEYRYFSCYSIADVKQLMGYSEDKSIYRIRRHVLDKLLISLNNLLTFK